MIHIICKVTGYFKTHNDEMVLQIGTFYFTGMCIGATQVVLARALHLSVIAILL
jgi:hypothetical protein